MTAISAALTGLITRLWHKMDKKEKAREEEQLRLEAERREELAREEAFKRAIREGMQAMLRDRIIQMSSYCIKQGHTQVYMVENMTHMFSSYTDLGGNGAVHYIFEKFMELPVIEEDPKEAKKG